MNRIIRSTHRAALAVCALLIVACSSTSDEGNATADEAAAGGHVTLRVMSFNIEWGGSHVRFASLADAIRAARADVVGIQEAEGNLAQLADDLGWYYSRRNYVISRFPLIDPDAGLGRFLYVEVAPGRVVAMANLHLPSSPSGTSWLRSGRTAADVASMEREVRLPPIEAVLGTLATIADRAMPVFLTGDFNAPSHADWTEAAVGKFPHRDLAFQWPVSRAVADAGFRDSFRTVHPDPVTHPGFTWWAGRPRIEDYNPSDPTRRSRIDFVWYAGPSEVSASLVVGEADAEGVDIAVSPWPSDHRAVVSVFDTVPAPMPTLIASGERVYTAGENVELTYQAASDTPPTLLLERVTAASEMTPRIRLAGPAASGTVRLPDGGLPAGHYRVSLLDPAGFALSRNEFWILQRDASPTLEISGERFPVGEALPFAWSAAPGNRYDWVGIFPADAPSDSHAYLTYGYVDARSSGSMLLGAENAEADWPLPPGDYVARLLLDDGFEILAESTPFTVTD